MPVLFPAAFLLLLFCCPADAQYFGKNKVQYTDFEWSVIRTEHFEVFYYETEKETALDAARMAERSYERLSRILGYSMKRPIPLILYASHSDFQQTNITMTMINEGTGGMTEFLKRRVVLPFTGSYSELEHVLTHELVHAFQVEILFGSSGSVLANTVGFSPPLWFMEGMAEYLSIGEVDRHTDMWLRDAALQGYLISIGELSHVYDIRVYRFGQSIMKFLADRYGDEKIGEILKAAPRAGGLERAFQAVLGISIKKFSEEWLEDVRRTYLPQIVDYSKPEKFARPITSFETDLGSMNLVPAVSPSGEYVVFISDRDMYSSLYLASTRDGKILDKLIEGEKTGSFESLRFFNTSIAWSPCERYIAFPAKVGACDAIYIYDIERRKVHRRLTFDFDGVLSPSWSPDGERLVFVVLENGRSNLFACHVDGSRLTRLTGDRFTCRDPAWSPDGRTIAFTTDRGGDTDFETLEFGDYRIALYDVEHGTITVLDRMNGKNIAPQWSPDGKEIIFVSDRSGISNIYSIQLETGEVFPLTNILTGVTGIVPASSPISWSRNGKNLVFSAFSRGRWDLYNLNEPLRLKHIPLGRPEIDSEPPVAVAAVPAESTDAADEPEPVEIAMSGSNDGDSGFHLIPGVEDPIPPGGDRPGPEREREREENRLVDLRLLFPEEEAPDPDPVSVGGNRNGGMGALPDTSDFKFEDYKLRFTQDFVFGAAAFSSNIGFLGQSAISFSDILGNHNITFAAGIYGSLSDADVYLSYMNLKKRMNWAVSLFQHRDYYYIYTADKEAGLESRIFRGVQLMVSRPFSRFSRIDFGLRCETIQNSIYMQTGYNVYNEVREEPQFAVEPFVAFVTDNVIYGMTGPIKGARTRHSVEYTTGDLRFGTMISDVRKYWNIRRRFCLATRLTAGASVGEDSQYFRIGGPYTFRGIDYGDLRAKRIGMVNLEFRYPLIESVRFGWPLPLYLRGIGGTMFLDGAAGWYGDGKSLEPIHNSYVDPITGLVENAYMFSYGFGARVNLGMFILRWDWGQLTDFRRNLGPPISFFTLAADF